MRVFITGITGTLGTALAIEHAYKGDEVFGCCRSESNYVKWSNLHPYLAKVYLADVISFDRKSTASDALNDLSRVDRVYHCAALKHIDQCEKMPNEAIWQNVWGTSSVAATCQRLGIPFVFISTDKACAPNSVYGATKFLGERIALSVNGCVIRLGNLIGSSGSVFQTWKNAKKNGDPITITDPEMTRFFIEVFEAARFIRDHSQPDKIIAPMMRSIEMGKMAEYIATSNQLEIIGRREGESKHQYLIAPGETYSDDKINHLHQIGNPLFPQSINGYSSFDAPRWGVEYLARVAGI